MQTYVQLDQIDDNPFQRRTEYGDLEDLAARIRAKRFDFPDTYGLMQVPVGRIVLVEPLSTFQAEQLLRDHGGLPGGMYRVQLAFGHRRLRAFRLLAETYPDHYGRSMPINVLQLTDDQMLDSCWSENRERRELSAVEEAELLAEKLERARAEGGNQQTVADAWGLSRPTIANRLRLLDLPAEVQQANRDGRLSERQALALLPVYDLEAKLNGTAVEWGDTGRSWLPRSPAGYVAKVLAEPDKATSDAIRDYTQTAIRHAGKPLGDSFAAYDAGQGRHIVQSACKGCPKRINQHCFHTPCYDARRARYFAAIPEWAARETGLPVGDADDFPEAWGDQRELDDQWKAGNHTDLVVGVSTGSAARPFAAVRYPDEGDILNNWRNGVRLGRAASTDDVAAGTPEADALALRPKPSERAIWKKAQAKADRDRSARAKRALQSHIALLVENNTEHSALRPLVAMLDGYWLEEQNKSGAIPTTEELVEHLFDRLWRSAATTGYDTADPGNRTPLRKLLNYAGIHPDLVDPPDQNLRLLDIGQQTLLGYEESRLRVDIRYAVERLARVRAALDEFNATPHIVAANEDLSSMQLYLRAAADREEELIYAAQTAAATAPAEPNKEQPQ